MAQRTLHNLPICAKPEILELKGNLTIYKPELTKTLDGNIKKLELGSPSSDIKLEKVIMLLGATGSGKTTLINGLVNYLFGVQWDDPFRFKLITEPHSSNQAKSQTTHISCYTLYHQSGFKVPYNLTIIDTPGFGDVSGIDRDKEITGQIKDLFTTPGLQGIDHLDAVGFVASSSLPRLTPTQQYIFDQILRIFGKDMADNIFMLLTFCDGQKPQVLSGIEEAKIPYKQYFKFNNSALYADSKIDNSEEASYGFSGFDAMFWEMGAKSFEYFLDVLRRTPTKSLTLTKDVLTERESLEVAIAGIRVGIQTGLNKLEQLRMETDVLKTHEAEIARNEEFEYTVYEDVATKQYFTKPGQNTTTCIPCNRTCHDDCMYAADKDKKNCVAMDNHGDCVVCTDKCNWNLHQNLPYLLIYERRPVKRTFVDLKKRYEEAAGKKVTTEDLINKIQDDFLTVQLEVLGLTEKVRKAIIRLQKIALKPNPMTTPAYIDLMIEAEKASVNPGWKERVVQLQALKQETEYMNMIAQQGTDPLHEYKQRVALETNPEKKKKMTNILGYFKDCWKSMTSGLGSKYSGE